MADKLCKTCKYWDSNGDRIYEWLMLEDRPFSGEQKLCTKASNAQIGPKKDLPQEPMIILDDRGSKYCFYTHPNHGCKCWEAANG